MNTNKNLATCRIATIALFYLVDLIQPDNSNKNRNNKLKNYFVALPTA